MKRLLRRKKKHHDDPTSFSGGRAKALHLDTAFQNKGFADMENLEGSGSLFQGEDKYDFEPLKKENDNEDKDEMYGAKIEFFKYITNGNLQVDETTQVKTKKEKRKILFTETSFIGPNYEGQQIKVEMQVGKAERVVTKKGKKSEKANKTTSKESNYSEKKASSHLKRVADDIAEKNRTYPWKKQPIADDGPVLPHMIQSFGLEMNNYPGMSKQKKAKKKNSKTMEYQSYSQQIGGQIQRCISLPSVDISRSPNTYSSYLSNFDDLSLSGAAENEDASTISSSVTSKLMDGTREGQIDRDAYQKMDAAPTSLEYIEERTSEPIDESVINCDADDTARQTEEIKQTQEQSECTSCQGLQTVDYKQQDKEASKTNIDAKLRKTSIVKSKQNNSESEHGSHGNSMTGLRSEACITPATEILVKTVAVRSEASILSNATENSTEMVASKTTKGGKEWTQLDNGFHGERSEDQGVCNCKPGYIKPPATLEKTPSTCPHQSSFEINDEINLSGENDTDQPVMENGISKRHKLEESLINHCDFEHTVQINHTERHTNVNTESKRKVSSISGRTASQIKRDSSSNQEDTWSLIPSTVQYDEDENSMQSTHVIKARNLKEVSTTYEVATTSFITDIEERPSTVEGNDKKKVNMQDIELRLGAKSVSFHDTERARDVELGLEEERPMARHGPTLDKLSGILRDMGQKRKRIKSSVLKKLKRDTASDEQKKSGKEIELVEMRGSNNNRGEIIENPNNDEEPREDEAEEIVPLDSTFIIEGAKEAEEQLKTNKERLDNELIAEKSTIENLLGKRQLSHKKLYSLILVLWAIEADMPQVFFDNMRKSSRFNALIKQQIGDDKDLILHNMYSAVDEGS